MQKQYFKTENKIYNVAINKLTCNKFGLAEFLAQNHNFINFKKFNNALDVGAGVGVISIFLADYYQIKTDAIELNPIAYKCLLKNIQTYNLNSFITPINANFIDFYQNYSKYDLIISNPPINSNFNSKDFIEINEKTLDNIDNKISSFLTNSYRDKNNIDLIEHIFKFSNKHLNKNGNIVIVCCDIDCDSLKYVLKKAKLYNYELENFIEGSITPNSIGVENFISKNIKSYIFSFKRRLNVD